MRTAGRLGPYVFSAVSFVQDVADKSRLKGIPSVAFQSVTREQCYTRTSARLRGRSADLSAHDL